MCAKVEVIFFGYSSFLKILALYQSFRSGFNNYDDNSTISFCGILAYQILPGYVKFL